MSFFIDPSGSKNDSVNRLTFSSSTKLTESDDEDVFNEVEPPSFVKKILTRVRELNSNESGTESNSSATMEIKKNAKIQGSSEKVKQAVNRIDKILKKSIITPGYERLHKVPTYHESEKRLKIERKLEREKTKGKKWYGLPATELTDEVKNDLEVLQMRSVLDPKHFYKKNDLKVLPKYFQIGKIMDSPLDYYNNRTTKKERKRTLVDELMADAEFNKYNKRKFVQITEEKQKTHYKAYRSDNTDYKRSGYDRGHLAAAGNHKSNQKHIQQTFFLSNMAPQVGIGFNRHSWNRLEKHVRKMTKVYKDVYCCTGPLYLPRHETDGKKYIKYEVIGANNVAVPTHFFKILVGETPEGKFEMEAYVMPNQVIDDKTPLHTFQVPPESVERSAGLLFFDTLTKSKLNKINGKKC